MFPTIRAVARGTDPETSHEAAASVANLTRKQQRVEQVLREYGPMTDREVYLALLSKRYVMSTSGARTRRRELCDLGRVEWTGMTKRGKTGRRSRVWYAIDASMEINQMPGNGKSNKLMVECPGCGHVFVDEYSKHEFKDMPKATNRVLAMLFIGLMAVIVFIGFILLIA